jgi:limonene 1,2-monooxygenase
VASVRLQHGIFVPPYHDIAESPTIAMRRDLELVDWVEQLGFAEAWFGEHHSTGWETVCSPELMIAAAAERTERIRLGTGVVSLPYHHPLMVDLLRKSGEFFVMKEDLDDQTEAANEGI